MIELTRKRGHPVYLQIVEQFQRRIASGVLRGGEALPSVRGLARQLSINPNTVVRAYRELEGLGLVESRHGEGTFVLEQEELEVGVGDLVMEHARVYRRVSKELGCSLGDAVEALQKVWEEGESQ
jgi:GntR family transcriptional regulator